MRAPLALVIDDGNGARHVTARTSGLRFKKTAYGGDNYLSCTLNLPRGFFTDLSPNDPVTLYDGRTGAFLFRGEAHQPGVSAGPRGEVYELQAFGGAVRLQAVTKALAYVHAADDGWKRTDSTKGAHTDADEKNDGTPTLEVSWDKRFELETNDQGVWALRAFQAARLKIGRFRADVDAGVTDADFVMRLMTGTTVDGLTSAANTTASTSPSTLAATVGGGGISAGDDIAGLRVRYTGPNLNVKADTGTGGVSGGHADSTTGDVTGGHADTGTGDTAGGVPDKHHWFRFWDVKVLQLLKDKFGDDITDAASYTNNSVKAHEVIRDMIGRNMCPRLDPDKTTIGTFDYPIDALSYLDGISAGDMLEALRVFEPTLTWQVYGDEGNFDAWPSEPRYVISSRDGGVTHPGDDSASLANYVLVEWTDRKGRQQSKEVTTVVEGLDYRQQIDPISLPDGVGSEANAQRAGEKILELHNKPPKAGTAVVRRPILDLWTGAMVQPWELEPACLVVEQETGDVFRLTETEFSDDDCATVLTLGTPRKDDAQVIADLERKQRRRK